MPAPKKPRKTRYNQPDDFRQSLVPSLQLHSPILLPQVSAAKNTQNLSSHQLKMALLAICFMTVILAGVAFGNYIRATQPTVVLSGIPVASATLNIVRTNSPTITLASAPAPAKLKVVPVVVPSNQLAGGDPTSSLTIDRYQLTAPTDALQPGYMQYGLVQGTIGTDPVH